MKCLYCGFEWDNSSATCPKCGQKLTPESGESFYEAGIVLERKGQYIDAILEYQKAAELDVVGAAYAICRCLDRSGERVYHADLYEFWFETAALKDSVAAYAYAEYERRLGGEKNYVIALRHAADLENEDARIDLIRYFIKHGNKSAAKYYLQKGSAPFFLKMKLGSKIQPIEPAPIPPQDLQEEFFRRGMFAEEQQLYALAKMYYLMASKTQHARSYEKLISLCLEPKGILQKDPNLAVTCLQGLIELGNDEAYVRLGELYEKGDPPELDPNPIIALEYYEKGADQDVIPCMLNAAKFYLFGIGIFKNVSRALKYYDRAAELGSEQGSHAARNIRSNAELLYTKAQTAKRSKEFEYAYALYLEAAGYAHVPSIVELGDLMLAGTGCQVDRKGAVQCYRTAANTGNVNALYRLGWLYKNNFVVRYSYKKAKAYLLEAQEKGHPKAQGQLEELTLQRKKKLAQKLYSDACVAYHEDRKMDAAKLLFQASKLEHPRAMFLLACMYDCGDGIPQDPARASFLYGKTYQLGYDGKKTGYYGKYLKRLKR